MKLAVLTVLCLAPLLHTVAVKKHDRGVFVSAQALAVSCRAMKDAVGDDYLLGSQSTNRLPGKPTGDMVAVGRCTGYIEGVADEFREPMGSHRPFSALRGELPMLIDTFLKRVAEHPEEADFAASTVLHEADKDLLLSCGDCDFGLLVHPPLH